MSNFPIRRDRLRSQLAQLQIDALLVSHPVNVRYLTGFTGDASYLLVDRSRELLVSDGRFTEQIEQECPGLNTHIRTLGETTLQALGAIIQKSGFRNIGIEANRMTVAEFEGLSQKIPTTNWKSTQGVVEAFRAVKDIDEIKFIREAVAVAERVYQAFRDQLRPDHTELQLSDCVESLVRQMGGRGTSFDPIVAIGDRSGLAHAPPTMKRACEGNWLLLDWGAIHAGYRSDLTRILIPNKSGFQSGKSSKFDPARLAEVYRTVLQAQEHAIAAVRPGANAKDVDSAARAVFESAGMGERFSHSLGHGIGLETHEKPGLRMTSDEVLTAGMVVTIEPGAYIPGWGGVRIEDDVLVTPDGCESLSSLPRDFDSSFVN